MNITEKRQNNDEVIKLMKVLKFDKQPIELVGSASLKNMRYFGDYDFITNITETDAKNAYDVLKNIITAIRQNPHYYLIELKIQLNSGKKTKIYLPMAIDYTEFKKDFKKIDFVKLDIVIFIHGRFMEASVIYKFSDHKLTKDEYIKSLEQDIEDFKKDKKYYKVVKRLFNIHRAHGDSDKMHSIMSFLNDENFGKLYGIKSLMEANSLMKEHYKRDAIVKKKLNESLKGLKPYTEDDENKIIDALNKASKVFLDHLK
jgi:hypothetical protein